MDRAYRSLASKPAEGNRRSQLFIVKLHHYQRRVLILHLARKKAPLIYDGSTVHIFLDFSPKTSKQQATLSKSKQKLMPAKTKFVLFYLATLQFEPQQDASEFYISDRGVCIHQQYFRWQTSCFMTHHRSLCVRVHLTCTLGLMAKTM